MKKQWTKTVALATALVLALGACTKSDPVSTGGAGTQSQGQQGGQGTAPGEINKNAVWREEEIDLSGSGYTNDEMSQGVVYGAGKLHLFGMKEKDCFVVTMDADGSNMESRVLDTVKREGIWYGPFCVADDGAIYAVKTEYPESWYTGMEEGMLFDGDGMATAEAIEIAEGDVVFDETEEPETMEAKYGDEEGEAGDAEATGEEEEAGGEDVEGTAERYYIVKFDPSGEKVYETRLEPEQPEQGELDWYSVMDLRMAAEGVLLLNDNVGIYSVNTEDGTREKKIHDNGGNYTNLVMTGSREAYLVDWKESGMVLTALDPVNGKEGEAVELGQQMWLYDIGSAKPAAGEGFLLTENSGLARWAIGEEKPSTLVSFVDSDLDIEYVDNMVQVSDDEIILFYYRDPDGRVCSLLKRVDPADVKEKETLVLGANGMDSNLRSAIVQFNKTHENIRISVTDYSKFVSEDAWDAGYQQLNNDIIAGNAPDILLLDTGTQTRSYEIKGVLEPLDSYMANDPEISKTEYLDNVMDAYQYRGNHYLVTPAFSIRSYAMKKSDADKIGEWSLDSLQQMMKERNIDAAKLFGDWPMTQSDVVTYALVFDGKNYFDWDEHRVRFDSQSFIDLLNFAKQFPEEIDNQFYEKDNSGAYRSGEALIAQAFFGSFRDFRTLKYGSFGEDVTLIGFPREDGTGGSSVMAYTQLAMSAQSKNKDACWEFMRTFLLDDYQRHIVENAGYMFPVSKKVLDEMAKKSMEREYYETEDGQKEYYDESIWINGEEMKLGEMTQADVDQVYALFESVDSAFEYDETLLNMVQEEVSPFFKGQKSAEECAKIVQSKAQIYIDENS